MKIAVLGAGNSSVSPGGAERFYQGLLAGLRDIGCRAELISIPADEPDFAAIEKNYDYCRRLDLSRFDIVISTKAPTFAVRHPRHVMYLVHTVRVFDDMFDETFAFKSGDLYSQRARLHALDQEALSMVKGKFAIGHEVARRLYKWRGVRTEVIHPPLVFKEFRSEDPEDYFYIPGRLHPWKRVDLLIKAVLESEYPFRLIISGAGEAESELKKLAAGDSRIEFLGRVDDQRLVDLYAKALAVPFVPLREDYGYVTLEAFASGKPVLTSTDSGEPTRFVKHGETGIVCSPTPQNIRKGLEWLFDHRMEAARMGQAGSRLIAGMSWRDVARRLVDAATEKETISVRPTTRVAVLDMQPIDPPVGGGRLRLLGLYHSMGKNLQCRYIGSYDWPGEKFRCHSLGETLEEIDVPLSHAHHTAAEGLKLKAKGKTVIDLSFSTLAHLSPQYLAEVRRAVLDAEVVVFSHPWVYPLVADHVAHSQIVVYDSHNVEGYLRAQLLNEENPPEASLLRQVVTDEYALGCRADLIMACSQEDLERFNRIYEFDMGKMRVVPNGVMAFASYPPTPDERIDAKKELQWKPESFVGIFIGSSYGPNQDAAEFIVNELATALPDVTFVIAGGVGGSLIVHNKPNVVITGAVSEAQKLKLLRAGDIAVNPMFSGSGTNIKIFDFMAAGLPVVTTATGARGINQGGRDAFRVVDEDVASFAEMIREMKRDPDLRLRMGKEARICVEENYSWERISQITGLLLSSRSDLAGQAKPLFSVIIPTYERHDQLSRLVDCLKAQIERDFEVIIIDQSSESWNGRNREHGFPFTYYHSPVKGAVRARNTGALLAQGEIIAFTDDDCMPEPFWLLNARRYFEDQKNIGLEGQITSDHFDDPEWRPVTNIGFEGLGFMTANLMVRSSIFQALGGFDLQFDRPHFREDTDFGWRMQALGRVPYAKDVKVFHPAQSRHHERESIDARARFFEKDALLFKKHPERYQELFFAERHFEHTEGFFEHLARGFTLHDLEIPEWMKAVLRDQAEKLTPSK